MARHIFPEDKDLILLSETLALCHDALAYDTSQLPAQLHNRLWSLPKPPVSICIALLKFTFIIVVHLPT